jgi:hypothetical protein
MMHPQELCYSRASHVTAQTAKKQDHPKPARTNMANQEYHLLSFASLKWHLHTINLAQLVLLIIHLTPQYIQKIPCKDRKKGE